MPNIPFEIIEDILSRLPVKSLKRFRCVAKPWCALIDSQSFVKNHLRHSLVTNSNRSLIIGGLGLYTVDLDGLEKALVVKPPFYYKSDGISNSCNGLVLVTGEQLVLWNVFTTEYRILPPCPKENLSIDGCYSKVHYGFAYDEIDDDYKVVRVLEFRSLALHVWRCSEVFIYGLKSDAWKKIKGFPYPLPFLKGNWRVHVNGALHTLIDRFYNFNGDDDDEPVSGSKIMAFDVRSEDHSCMGLPSGIVVTTGVDLNLDMVGGCLSLVCTKRGRVVIWVMKKYGVRESWVKLVTIGPPSIEKHDFVRPLVNSEDGRMVLLSCDDKRLIWYNWKKKCVVVDDVNVYGMPFVFYAEPSVQSLVSLGREAEVKKPKPVKKKERLKNKSDDFLSEGFKLVL